MSYATMQDVLFDLDLTDLRNWPGRHPGVPATEAELPEEWCKSRSVAERKAAVRSKPVVEMSRVA
jgi:hypothetical protein